ncbi:unnamed protein product (macronuclear) [Paramecium tetraurelia]|uniref:Uncharacterized protein n=1 Tax=Paramecium tetraurelia TaxID=5888 RepID=A0BQD4_PARTE|nr:uncharacterized protein GSPATT00030980001 [Paramecium tetraurelia]CAK60751.1 unnamed protein product [Paramecium tetraurelia]|eukprot:XP_001428149.1 hypothetical protein (macronuclear) [Paramecium tetraurelia strain d4-2]
MKQQPEPEIPTLQQQDKYLERKRQGQGLDVNFKLFNDFLKLRAASFSKVTIMLLVSFFHQALSYISQQGQFLYSDISTLQIYTIQLRALY